MAVFEAETGEKDDLCGAEIVGCGVVRGAVVRRWATGGSISSSSRSTSPSASASLPDSLLAARRVSL